MTTLFAELVDVYPTLAELFGALTTTEALDSNLDGVSLVRAAVGETVILLHPPLHVSGVSMGMERERQHLSKMTSLANG